MKHHLFGVSPLGLYRVAVLIKQTAFNKQSIQQAYIDKLTKDGVSADDVIAFTLQYGSNGKSSVKEIKEYLAELLPELNELGTEYLYVADAAYFKTLTKQTKAEVHLGYILPCAIKGFEHMRVVLGINYQALIYDPLLVQKLDRGLQTIVDDINGAYCSPGGNVIHSAQYPKYIGDINNFLDSLHQYPELSSDIEAFSLRFNEAGIGTIGFAWDEHNGGAFACDYSNMYGTGISNDLYGEYLPNTYIRTSLKHFFTTYKGKLTWHSANYDLKVLIYTLWMDDYSDTAGLLKGLEVMTRLFDDTKIIAYLATNTTAGNVLGLKPLSQEFAGNYAQDEIKDIRKIPLDDLLEYNLVDCLATNYVKNKYTPIMVADSQNDIYQTLMLPSVKLLLQTELTGMPMSIMKIKAIRTKLEGMLDDYNNTIRGSGLIKLMNLLVQTSAMEAANAKLKTKQHTIDVFDELTFNPNSGPQLQRLLYELMGLPVLDYTDTKQPATGAETIEKLINHTDVPEYKAILAALIGHGQVSKILTTFIPAFERGIVKSNNGIIWLHGSFNIGGTVSGRLSSSDPNLQNIPANSIFGKLIKEAFVSPNGWIFAGADFNSLEDMISALTTRDSNKIKVYTDGYCGHCLRAFAYFKDELPGIVDTVDSINSIKKLFPDARQNSKAPTFLLTYGGTYHGMMKNLGWPQDKAQTLEAGYHALYAESDEYIQKRLKQASNDGYVEVAFGLRVRTPLLGQIVYGSSSVPYAASAEGRTAGNAMGQSYGLLNNRAAVDFMNKVWKSKYRLDVMPVALIHDAIYVIFRDKPEVAEWVNRELVLSMQWQDLPEIQHPTVKLGSALDIYWPNWANPITLPNNATKEEIIQLCNQAKIDYANKKVTS